MSDVNANININIATTAALANLKKLESEINGFQKTIASSNAAAIANQQALNKALLDGIKNTGMFDAKIVSAHDTVSRFNDQLDRGKLSLGQYTRFAASQLPGMSRVFKKEFDTIQQVAESRVKKINTQYLALGKTVDGITKAIAATPTSLGKGYATDLAISTQRQQLFNKMIDDGSTKLLNWGKNTQWAGRQLMVGFSLPMAALGTVAAKTFMEIDKATVALKRVYGDLNTTTGEINANVDALKKLGSEYTKYGISLQETINIGARAAATGARNQDLTAATEQTLRLATLGQIDYNQALDATISLQSAFGISSKDLGENIDYLNAVENQTILTLDDMTLAVPRVATVIKGLGGDVKDLAVFMTAMREGGVSAENAANALKSGLGSLINPTKAATDTLGKFGININAIVKTNKGDLMGLITDFGRALNSLDEFQRQQALEKVFGKYQYARMGALFTNITKDSSQAARAMDIAKMSAEELASVANKELGTVSESTSVKFQAAMEQLKISIAPLGEAFLKGITPVVNMVTKVADAFNNLPDGVKNAVAVIAAALAGLGPVLLMSIGLLGNGLANIAKGVQFLRRTLARIRGEGEAFNYMSAAELEAVAATNSLNTSAGNLTGTLNLQKQAVSALTVEYERFAAAAGIAGSAMRRVGGGGGGKGSMRTPVARATGGTIPGSGNTDSVPAMLTPGEFVVNKQATQSNLPLLQAINDGQVQGFAGGGLISLFKRGTGLISGLRLKSLNPAHGGSLRRAQSPEALSYATLERQSSPFWTETQYLPEITKKAGQTRIADKKVIGHIYSQQHRQKHGGARSAPVKTGAELQQQYPELRTPTGRVPRLESGRQYDVLSSQFVMFDERFNSAVGKGVAKAGDWRPVYGKDMLSLLYTLMSPPISLKERDARIVAARAARTINRRMRTYGPNESVDETLLGQIITGSTIQALKSSRDVFRRYPGVKLNSGNVVPGQGNSDTVPAMLTPGEFVVNKKATSQNLPLLHAINNGDIRGYNEGDVVQSSRVGYGAPPPISNQTKQMEWASRASEMSAAQKVAERWNASTKQVTDALTKVAAHIIEPEAGIAKLWKPKQLTTDLQAVNNYMNRVKSVSRNMLANTETLQKISKSTGLSIKRVQRELENFARGQHPITEKSARVLEKVASMDEAASRMAKEQGRRRNIFGARTETGYMAGMTRAILRERRLSGNELYRNRGRFRYTGPIIETQRTRSAGGRTIQQPMAEPTAHGGMIPMMGGGEPQSGYSPTSKRAREIMKERGLTGAAGRAEALRLARSETRVQKRPKFGKAMGRIGGVVGMASMVPFMAQDEQGKFMGMDANMLGMGMMGASMITPLFSALSSGAGALAGALGVTTAAVAAPVAALVAVAAGAWMLKKGMDNTIEAARKYGDSLTTSAEEQKSIADVFGTKTYAERRKEKRLARISGLSKEQQGRGKEFLTTDIGKQMQEEAKISLENRPGQFAKNLGTQLSQAVVSGAMTATDAKAVGAALAESLGRQDLTASIVGQIDKILAPNGDDVTNTPIQIMGQITASIETDEQSLKRAAEGAAQQYGDSWTDNFLGLGALYSGEYDQMIAANVAYTEAVFDNTKSILSSYDDQIMAQDDLIKSINDQIESEKDQTKKEELETKKRFAIRQKDELIQKRRLADAQRRDLEYQTLYGAEQGRAERRTATRQAVEQAAPGLNAETLLTGGGIYYAANAPGGVQERKAYTGGFLGKMLKQTTGAVIQDTQQFEYKFLVDLAAGRIDPLALNVIKMEEEKTPGTANLVLGTIVDLQMKGDIEQAGQLTLIASQLKDNPEISTIFNAQVTGMTTNELLTYGQVLLSIRDLPSDIYKSVAIELSGMTQQQMKDFQQSLTDLQKLNISPVQIIEEGGVRAISEATKATDSLAGSLKKYGKEIKNINKGSKDGKIERTWTVVNKMVNEEGVQITPEQFNTYVDELVAKTKMTKEEVLALPPKTLVQTFYMKTMAEDLRRQAQVLEQSAQGLSPQIAAALLEQAKELNAAANALEGGAVATATGAGYGGGAEQAPPETPRGGGAGGGAKSFKQQLLEQLKLFVDATATMKDLNNAKKNFLSEIVKGAGLLTQVSKLPVGTNPALMEYLSGLAPDELKKWVKENTVGGKGRRLNVAGRVLNRRVTEVGIGRTMTETGLNIGYQQQQIQAANLLTGRFGGKLGGRLGPIRSDVMQQIAGDPDKAAQLVQLYKDVENNVKGSKQALIDFVNQQQLSLDNAKLLERSMDPIQAEIDDTTLAHEKATKEIERQKQPLEDQIDIYNKQIEQLQSLNDADNHRIQGLNRQKEMIQRQIDAMQYQNELDQRKIDNLRREDELRNRVSDALSHDLEILSQQEQKIRDGYQKRIDALNKVAEINQHIIEQQQQQISLSQALSQGDIYAAAGQVIQARQSNAAFAAQQQQNALQAGMENAVGGLRTAGGLTRDQAEQQIANIKEQSYQTSLQIQKIEDQIYQRNLDMIPLKDAQYKIDLAIIPIADAIYDREQSIYDIETNKITPLQQQIDKLDEQQATLDRIFNSKIDQLEAEKLQADMTNAQITRVNELGNQWATVRDLVGEINGLIASGGSATTGMRPPKPQPLETPTDYAARLRAFRASVETRIAEAKAEEEKKKQGTANKFAGGFIRAATGMMIPGTGGMDTVPVMATPGEFVMRKASVKKYGSALMEAINTGSFSLPQYNMPSVGKIIVQPARTTNASINAPVYNGYNVNVNVAGTNASADEIANRTITRIKEMQNVNIRSARGK